MVLEQLAGMAIGAGVNALSGGSSAIQPLTYDIGPNKLYGAQKDQLTGYMFGPQNINPDALLGGQGAQSAYQNMMNQSGGRMTIAPNMGGSYGMGSMVQQPQQGQPINMQGMGTGPSMYNPTPQQTLNQTGSYGGTSLDQLRQSLGLSYDKNFNTVTQPAVGKLDYLMGRLNTPNYAPTAQDNSNPTANVYPTNAGASPFSGMNLADVISTPGLTTPQVKAAGMISQGMDPGQISALLKGKNPTQVMQILQSLGMDTNKIQDAMQTGGYNQLANAFNGANAFGGTLANTIGNTQDLAQQAMWANSGNVDALRNATMQGQNDFSNYFNNNLNDFSGFQNASNYLQGIDLSGAQNMANQMFGAAGQNIGMGQNISNQALSDTDYMRQMLNQDRSTRDAQLAASQGFNVSPDLTNLANQLYSQNVGLGQNDLYNGTTSEAFRRQMLDTQNALAERGLGMTSSAFSDAAGRVQQQRDVMNQQLINQELSNRTSNIMNEANLNKQLAMQGAGLTNQSSVAFAGNLPALYNASTGGLEASNQAIGQGINSGNLLNNIANTQLGIGTGMGNIANQQMNAANNAASTMLQGNQLTQQGLNNVGQLANQGNQLGLNSLIQSGQLANSGMNSNINMGQLGLDTQGQAFNETTAQLQAIMDRFNSMKQWQAAREAALAGAGGGGVNVG